MIEDGAVIVDYIDENGKDIKISQNIKSGGIMIASRVKPEDYKLEFHAMAGPDTPRYDEEGLINWYNTEYKKLQGLFEETYKEYAKKKTKQNIKQQ